MFRGVAVSPGVVVGVARKVESLFATTTPEKWTTPDQAAREIERFDHAVEAATVELNLMVEKVKAEVGPAESDIFRSHLAIVRDPSLRARVHEGIKDRGLTAAGALVEVYQDYAVKFAKLGQERFRERMADIQDALQRIAAQLDLTAGVIAPSKTPAPSRFPGHLVDDTGGSDDLASSEDSTVTTRQDEPPLVLVAHELLPSQALGLGDMAIAGIVTEIGGSTSHAAILSRSKGIPAVSGVVGIMAVVKDGDPIIVDGREGLVQIRPEPESASAYRKLQREFVRIKDRLILPPERPAATQDGTPIELLANVNGPDDVIAALRAGAGGVGLFRTEYLFLAHHDFPDEDEQYEHYRRVVENAQGKPVTIRALDLGGDKSVPFLGQRHEANPALGWRSIRLVTEHARIFERQIRAILRAAAHGKVNLLFPMITHLEELKVLNRLVGDAIADLDRQGIPRGAHIKCGVMIEVPAAAIMIDAILRETEFISIGSNDLIQYLVAADRDNPKVAHLCDPLHPAVFRVIRSIIEACQRTGVPLTVCGEMAGQPRAALALLGLGARRFSMSPAFVPTIKTLLSSVSLAQAERFAHHVLQLKTSREIRAYLSDRLREVSPELAMLDFC
ncbi:phosphoenolpyruvate-protein phosphotransferase [Isosphaera pallida ATCC 43644]|uniref:Phosphoenolpyruvate-protein phosphotransferase n=1 Tax=Isosphaera pallida (strain ATCC 43644 / DSM 9630 / IS1B) TaxID=575540 RepID=E8R162_ISOPI|nr:phosphoenolpyruvate-protein phosphotransferase [Isosphaera pallida ATCC 43644]